MPSTPIDIGKMENQVIHGDCFDILKSIPDKSVDVVITDPPYGIGLGDWDKPVDITLFTKEVKRITKNFYAFFGQMPTMIDWINAANTEKLHYLEHISWVRRIMSPSHRISRGHESILIYSTGKKKFYNNQGRYEDVKIPGVLVDIISLQGLDRYIKDLRLKIIKGDSYKYPGSSISSLPEYIRYNSIPKDRSPEFVNFTNVWSFLPPTQSKHPDYSKKSTSQFHPTSKPLEVMKRLVEMLSPDGGVILDPFAGSGTTALSCKELGRKYICIEKEEKYYQIACQRLKQPTQDMKTNLDENQDSSEEQQLTLFS